MPNSSARCAQLPRAVDKVPFYAALKKFRDYLRGDIQELDESDVVFPEVKLQNFNNKRIKKEEFGDEMNSEAMEGEDRIDPLTGKKRRGRPPKPRPDGSMPAPKRRRVDEFGNPLPKGSKETHGSSRSFANSQKARAEISCGDILLVAPPISGPKERSQHWSFVNLTLQPTSLGYEWRRPVSHQPIFFFFSFWPKAGD